MSKQRKGRKRRGFPKPLRKALSSALLAGAVLVPTAQASGEQPPNLTITQRVIRVREAINSRVTQNDPTLDDILSKLSHAEMEVAQWGKWANWNNWGNWANWNNWGNWANWNNWGNQWGNWGNF